MLMMMMSWISDSSGVDGGQYGWSFTLSHRCAQGPGRLEAGAWGRSTGGREQAVEYRAAD